MATTELDNATQQLADVRTAITAVLKGGQSYTIDGRTSMKANLKELREMESALVSRIARLSRGGLRIQRVVPL